MRFENQVALITGGSRGIGLATAKLFAAEGARVALVARDQRAGRAAADQIPGAIFLPGDVTRPADCEHAVGETWRAWRRLDILFNNAGVIYRNRLLEATTEQEWDETLNTNLKGTFLMCKYALPRLRETGGGAIVNAASYAGLVGFAGAAAYCASKSGIIGLTRALALDHAREGIRVNCICPGSVDTDMIHAAWEMYGDVEAAARLWAAKHPLGRIASPEEIARVVLFLAGEDASFITGAAVPVDGGITAG